MYRNVKKPANAVLWVRLADRVRSYEDDYGSKAIRLKGIYKQAERGKSFPESFQMESYRFNRVTLSFWWPSSS